MPRDGSPTLPAGVVPPAPMTGEIANPPFAVLPDPGTVFKVRTDRLLALAGGHQIEPYLRFLARLTDAQHDAQSRIAQPAMPAADRIARARDNQMPPLSIDDLATGEHAGLALKHIAERLLAGDLTDASRTAATTVLAAGPGDRSAMMRAVLMDEIPQDKVGEHVIAAAAAQVHYTRLAARLQADTLTRVADGACPSCGSAPVASAVVGWEGAHGTRFCTCSICATQWHVVRIRCLVCGSEDGIAYHSVEGGPADVYGETCESCSTYVKILHQHKAPALDPLVDDVASLALDVVLSREGWLRGSVNPFLMGY